MFSSSGCVTGGPQLSAGGAGMCLALAGLLTRAVHAGPYHILLGGHQGAARRRVCRDQA